MEVISKKPGQNERETDKRKEDFMTPLSTQLRKAQIFLSIKAFLQSQSTDVGCREEMWLFGYRHPPQTVSTRGLSSDHNLPRHIL